MNVSNSKEQKKGHKKNHEFDSCFLLYSLICIHPRHGIVFAEFFTHIVSSACETYMKNLVWLLELNMKKKSICYDDASRENIFSPALEQKKKNPSVNTFSQLSCIAVKVFHWCWWGKKTIRRRQWSQVLAKWYTQHITHSLSLKRVTGTQWYFRISLLHSFFMFRSEAEPLFSSHTISTSCVFLLLFFFQFTSVSSFLCTDKLGLRVLRPYVLHIRNFDSFFPLCDFQCISVSQSDRQEWEKKRPNGYISANMHRVMHNGAGASTSTGIATTSNALGYVNGKALSQIKSERKKAKITSRLRLLHYVQNCAIEKVGCCWCFYYFTIPTPFNVEFLFVSCCLTFNR